MIFRWLYHDDFRLTDKVIAVLADLGMVSSHQLAKIFGISRNLAYHLVSLVRKKNTEDNERWIKTYRTNKQISVYTLGPAGIYYAAQLIGRKITKAPDAQMSHFLGINDILVRLLERGVDRRNIIWLGTAETNDFLVGMLERNTKTDVNRRDTIWPDAFVSTVGGSHGVWLEYDNDTETTRVVERKYHDYIRTLRLLDTQYPVFWVAKNQKRRDFLERNWQSLARNFYTEQTLPDMHFFTVGEETDKILHLIFGDTYLNDV